MTTCTVNPVSASVDMDGCKKPPESPPENPPAPGTFCCCCCCCAITDTPCSHFCGGCTWLRLGHIACSVYFCVYFATVDPYIVAATCMGLYTVLLQAQSVKRHHYAQLLQSMLCLTSVCVSASCTSCAAMHWVLLLATIVHLGTAFAMIEVMRIGDCRRCLNEAHRCECGSKKDPIPPGALATLVNAIEARWVPLAQRPHGIGELNPCLGPDPDSGLV